MKLPPFILPSFFVLAFAVCSSAQEVPRPPARPSGAPPREAARPGAREIALADIFDEYSRLTGKEIVTDNTISINTPCALPGPDGVSPQQRINLIERTLFLSSYTLVDADADTVMVLGPGRNPRQFGLPLYSKPEEFPNGERVFSCLCKLEHRDVIEIVGILQQFIPQGNDVNFTADIKSHTVIATAPTSIMRTVLRVVAALDVAADGAGR